MKAPQVPNIYISTGTILAYLGKVRTLQGLFEEGLKYYERAFNSWCAAGGKHDYSMGRLYYWLAIHYFRASSLDTATWVYPSLSTL